MLSIFYALFPVATGNAMQMPLPPAGSTMKTVDVVTI
jgi:hypothetical protein